MDGTLCYQDHKQVYKIRSVPAIQKLSGTYIAFRLLKCIIRYQRPDLVAKFGHHGVTRPIFPPGDGIAFDHLAFHRTYFTEAMARPRMSIEIRACHPEVLLKAYGEVHRITVSRHGDKFEMWYSRPIIDAASANFPTDRLSSAAKRLRHLFRTL
jgi:hypothetical protein